MKHLQNERIKKKVLNKKRIVTKILEVEAFFWTLVIAALKCYYGDNRDKIRTSFKTLVSKKATTWWKQKISVTCATMNFYKK